MAHGTRSGNLAAPAQLWDRHEGFGPAAELEKAGRKEPSQGDAPGCSWMQEKQQRTPCPLPAQKSLTHRVLQFPIPELLPLPGSLRPQRCSGGLFGEGDLSCPGVIGLFPSLLSPGVIQCPSPALVGRRCQD